MAWDKDPLEWFEEFKFMSSSTRFISFVSNLINYTFLI